jgi:hypothetical protein
VQVTEDGDLDGHVHVAQRELLKGYVQASNFWHSLQEIRSLRQHQAEIESFRSSVLT